jgi:curved DNA-binding protein CbpA
MTADPYEVLHVSRTASLSEIKKAYHRESRLFHPDLLEGRSKAIRLEGEKRQKQLKNAYAAIIKIHERENAARQAEERKLPHGRRRSESVVRTVPPGTVPDHHRRRRQDFRNGVWPWNFPWLGARLPFPW